MGKLNEIVSNNLVTLRKQNHLTQAELASKLNYSDKTISKWETGETLPDIEVLHNITEIYNVSLDFLVTAHTEEDFVILNKEISNVRGNKIVISLLSVSVIWIIITILYVYKNILNDVNEWTLFIWGLPISCIILLVFNSIWGKRRFNYLILSVFTWTLITSFFLQFLEKSIWPLFLIGIPFQIVIILWSQLRKPKK